MIVLYSSNCYKCKIIEEMLRETNNEYILVDDKDIYSSLVEKYNIASMPFAEVDNTILEADEIIKYIGFDKLID